MNDPKIQDEARQPEADARKQAYEKPAITYRAPLEATAGACDVRPPGKTNIGSDVCSSTAS
ncbi:MAG: hypothetical protein FJ009_15655 [Chloroflexi bacterium]|nr:hypothetical protein [Chloroflexota bacterium]